MKIKIDKDNKVITIDESVTMDELFTSIKKRLPNNSWKDFTLDIQSIMSWRDRIIIRDCAPIPCAPNVPNLNNKNITCKK